MRFEHMAKSFGDKPVFTDFSWDVPAQGIVGVVGPSGCGKTTLLRIIAGLETPDDGALVDAPERVSMLFEDDRLFRWMSVAKNIELVGASVLQTDGLLSELGIEHMGGRRIDELSGGQRRRVAIARALAAPGNVLLLDEPTIRLDASTIDLVLDAIEHHRNGRLALIATHDERTKDRCDSLLDLSQLTSAR